MECLNCHKRFRADQLIEEYAHRRQVADPGAVGLTEVPCPNCGSRGRYTDPRDFNMMLKTYLRPIKDATGLLFLLLNINIQWSMMSRNLYS